MFYAIYMSLKWKIIEKIIAVLLIIFAASEFYSVLFTIDNQLNIAFGNQPINWENVSFVKLFKTYHLETFVSVFTFIAAVLLLIKKRVGWTLSIAVIIINILSYLIFLFHQKGRYEEIRDFLLYFICSLIIIIYLAFLILLFQKPIREKYFTSRKASFIIGLIVGIYLIDRILILFNT